MKKVKGIAIAGETSTEFYYDLICLRVKVGTPHVFLDHHHYVMAVPSFAKGTDCYISATEFMKIYGPYLDIQQAEDTVVCQYQDQQTVLPLSREEDSPEGCALMKGEELFLPLVEVMVHRFGKNMVPIDNPRATGFICVSDNEDHVSPEEGFRMNLVLNGKPHGDQYGVFWFEEARKLVPYHAYVPFTYNGSVPAPLCIFTHGGGCDHNDAFVQSHGGIQREAEKHGIIIWSLNGLYMSSWFGGLCPTSNSLDTLDPSKVDRENPQGISAEAIRLRKIAERAVKASVDLALSTYKIDSGRVYAVGNSMGAAGVFHLATLYPGLFAAIFPCGGFVNPYFYDCKHLGNTKVNTYIGSEDEHDPEITLRAAEILRGMGFDVSCHVIGGVNHKTGYLKALPEMFVDMQKIHQ